MLPWSDDESKITMLQELGNTCFEKNLTSIALLNDAIMKSFENKPDSVIKMPSEFPVTDRIDCVTLIYIDFMDSKENTLRAYPYKILDGKIIREEVVTFKDSIISMDSLIISCITMGFLKAAILDEYSRKEILDSAFTKEVGDMLLMEVLRRYPGIVIGGSPITEDVNEKPAI
jgi:hypothetical protein